MDLTALVAALPAVNSWIDNYIDQNRDARIRIADIGFERLPLYYSSQLLENAYCVIVPKIIAPPLSELGLGELSFFEGAEYGGITYKDTFFATSMNESLHFHEMIHIIQWDELGAERFLLVYAVGLLQYGYRESPLEQVAYGMQSRFEAGERIDDLEQFVRSHCRELLEQLGIS